MKPFVRSPKKPLVNKTFLKFVIGFIIILLIAIAGVIATKEYEDILNQLGNSLISETSR